MCDVGNWCPLEIGRDHVPVSHLLFADDLILFGRVDKKTATSVREILQKFCIASGQKVNELKSCLSFSPNTLNHHKRSFQDAINISETDSLDSYLGLPLKPTRLNKNDVQFVVDKVRTKLALWKTNLLSRAGRLCLINSTINTIPAYYMQTHHFPISTLRELDRICVNFLWGNMEGKHRMHLVNKEMVFCPKNMGGLGIRSNLVLNKVLMAKLGWKLSMGNNNLAKECIFSKYVNHRYVLSFKKGSKIWKSLGKGWDLMTRNSLWCMGEGRGINFWKDNWLGLGTIRELFPGPLTRNEEEITVDQVYGGGEWHFDAISFDFPWEFKELIISNFYLRESKEDTPVCRFVSNGKFSISEAYQSYFGNVDNHHDLSWLWKLKVPPKFHFFLWLAWYDKLPHKSLLYHRSIVMDPRCTRCTSPQNLENTLHILRSCPKAQEVWNLFNPPTCFQSNDLCEWLRDNLRCTDLRMGLPWNLLFPCLCHEIWKSRNQAVFENVYTQPATTFHRAISFTWELSRSNRKNSPEGRTTGEVKDIRRFLQQHVDFFMVNVDASFTKPMEPTGVGGVIRNTSGIWVQGFVRKCYATSPLAAELIAIKEGLLAATQAHVARLLLLSDCKKAIDLILHDVGVTLADPYYNLVLHCRELRAHFEEVIFAWIRREENCLTDCLAKTSRMEEESSNVARILDFIPIHVLDFYVSDCNWLEAIDI